MSHDERPLTRATRKGAMSNLKDAGGLAVTFVAGLDQVFERFGMLGEWAAFKASRAWGAVETRTAEFLARAIDGDLRDGSRLAEMFFAELDQLLDDLGMKEQWRWAARAQAHPGVSGIRDSRAWPAVGRWTAEFLQRVVDDKAEIVARIATRKGRT